jgi:hypothetical protein
MRVFGTELFSASQTAFLRKTDRFHAAKVTTAKVHHQELNVT